MRLFRMTSLMLLVGMLAISGMTSGCKELLAPSQAGIRHPPTSRRTQTTQPGGQTSAPPAHLKGVQTDKVKWKTKTDAYWRKVLSPTQFQVCRKAGTERPWTGKLLKNKKKGYYVCSSCGLPLFHSQAKFNSGTGWPSFTQPYQTSAVGKKVDRSYGMVRVEVVCHRCNAHLGHVFPDGPKPTGQRYCINSVCLHFQETLSSSPNTPTPRQAPTKK